jgi:hypothetical protein
MTTFEELFRYIEARFSVVRITLNRYGMVRTNTLYTLVVIVRSGNSYHIGGDSPQQLWENLVFESSKT